MDQEPDEIESRELEHRVLFSLLSLVVRMAAHQGMGLKDVTDWVRVAYFKELRERGMSMAEVADTLGVSPRTAKSLARELRESFFLPEREHNLPTMIEFMLWRVPMSATRLHQVLSGFTRAEIDEALSTLERQERIRLDDSGRTPMYTPTRSVNALVKPEWVGRIGGLNSMIGNLFDTVLGRFFHADKRAFARTLTFYLTRGRYAQLESFFKEHLVPLIADLDQASHEDDAADPIRLTIFWAPMDHQETP